MPDADEVLSRLVKASVGLAIVRHGLEVDGEMDDAMHAAIAADTWNALRGIDTCADEPLPELTAARNAMKEAARARTPL